MSGPRVAVRSQRYIPCPVACWWAKITSHRRPQSAAETLRLRLARWVAWWSVCLVRADSSMASVTGQAAIG